ncbi:MAG: adenylyl cyclase, partial [Gammaproteobacteria bacterium]
MSLFAELKRRNVFRVGIAYAVVAWVLLQAVDIVVPILGLPEWTAKFILLLLVVGLPLALFFAWAYEITPETRKGRRPFAIDHAQDQSQTRL